MTYQPATRHTKPATGDTETGLEKGSYTVVIRCHHSP